ncbi:MAG: sigma-54-dependent transcriptional regulator, partial [Gemmatimonadales bacterium]
SPRLSLPAYQFWTSSGCVVPGVWRRFPLQSDLVLLAGGLVAASAAMISVVARVVRFARRPDPVVIVGPTGCGKSTLAQLLHTLSGRSGRLAEISAGELDSALARDDLFGHGRGAFTGAVGERRGLFAEAEGGTVLLDDFHLLRRSRQHVLLRVLDRLEFRRLGSDRAVPMLARIVVGTHDGLDELERRGRLVPDLRWRLGLHEVRVPPLADRLEDIGLLGLQFLEQCRSETKGAGPSHFDDDVLAALALQPSWRGNVRQLRAVVRLAFTEAMDDAAIRLEHLVLDEPTARRFDPSASPAQKRRLVQWALWHCGGHITKASQLIGAHRNTVSAIGAELRGAGVAHAAKRKANRS